MHRRQKSRCTECISREGWKGQTMAMCLSILLNESERERKYNVLCKQNEIDDIKHLWNKTGW